VAEYETFTAEEERELAVRKDNGDQEARDKLIMSVFPWTIRIAMGYQHNRIDMDDLIQAGCVGAMYAVDRFKHERGYRLITYATWWIRQSVFREYHRLLNIVRIPECAYRATQSNRASEEITAAVKQASAPTLSLTAGRDRKYQGRSVLKKRMVLRQDLLASVDRSCIFSFLDLIGDDRRRKILEMWADQKPVQEIANTFDISEQRIRDIIVQVLKELQSSCEDGGAE
jgi:RNA polymerase sigma factor (sigma-70 family)